MENRKGFVNILFILLGAVLLIGILSAVAGKTFLAASGDAPYIPEYPANPYSRVFEKVKGYMKCEYTDAFTSWSQHEYFVKHKRTLPFYEYWEAWIDCPVETGTQGCQVKIDYFKCDGGTNRVWKPRGSSVWQSYPGGMTNYIFGVPAGSNNKYVLGCANGGASLIYKPYYSRRFPEKAIYVYDGTGRVQSGRLYGSGPDCKLVSVDAAKLKNLQPSSKPLGIEQLGLGDTVDLTVGWQEVPGFGNINPLGQYDGQDVVCKAYTGIYRADKIGTVGGIVYYKQGSQLVSYSGQNSMCCMHEDSQCAGGYKCEGYKCVVKPVTCSEGQCNSWQRGTTLYVDKEIEESGKFFLETATCDSNACIQTTKKEVRCTRAYCSRMFPEGGYYCSHFEGCVKLPDVKKQCPDGQCCKEGHSEYKVQNCPSGQECCIEMVSNDPLRGECQSTCADIPKEDCYNDVDDDGDGLVDDRDPDCQVCVVDGVDLKLAPRQCCGVRGGRWFEVTSKPRFWEFWKSEKTTGFCRIPHLPLFAVLLLMIGLVLLFVMTPMGIVLTIISILWIILASAGMI